MLPELHISCKTQRWEDSDIIMNETIANVFTPDTKRQSRQWLPINTPAQSTMGIASPKKMPSSAWFTFIMPPLGICVIAKYFVDALGRFLKTLNKGEDLALHGLSSCNASVYLVQLAKDFMEGVHDDWTSPFRSDLAPLSSSQRWGTSLLAHASWKTLMVLKRRRRDSC